MAQYDPTWSYGETNLIDASGKVVCTEDDIWSYGENKLFFEYLITYMEYILKTRILFEEIFKSSITLNKTFKGIKFENL